jgi:hypothetical protein
MSTGCSQAVELIDKPKAMELPSIEVAPVIHQSRNLIEPTRETSLMAHGRDEKLDIKFGGKSHRNGF